YLVDDRVCFGGGKVKSHHHQGTLRDPRLGGNSGSRDVSSRVSTIYHIPDRHNLAACGPTNQTDLHSLQKHAAWMAVGGHAMHRIMFSEQNQGDDAYVRRRPVRA